MSLEIRLLKLEREQAKREALDREIEQLIAELPTEEVEHATQEVEEQCRRLHGD
jgi:hypothetical protein